MKDAQNPCCHFQAKDTETSHAIFYPFLSLLSAGGMQGIFPKILTP